MEQSGVIKEIIHTGIPIPINKQQCHNYCSEVSFAYEPYSMVLCSLGHSVLRRLCIVQLILSLYPRSLTLYPQYN